MIKVNKLLLGVACAGMLGIGAQGFASSSQSVQAASWHKGTPKSIRGKYKTHHFGADLVSIIDINKKSLRAWQSGMPPQEGSNVRYKRLGKNKYLFMYDTKRIGIYRGEKNAKLTFQKVGKKYKSSFASQWYYKY
ncbi:hypothetical protein [Lactobacillus intestinalis]|uniref:Uncharacterized protein n=2 Tax=Lactobacillus intestinalis TaxID=151781 RepID=A0A4S2BL19_9LACO|nr:hypothetical protein [Lactobacillus intestinalis]KRM32429.1 hypothetical protein FC44_GL001851 [Lactobacillus intestinalis DSM 6629]TGY15281.1 hypothetical protein E5351_05580 [Lactobacillus intestinalis]UTW39796.1 hypothetical protein KBW87_05005 [Lactobacillus intestinalis]